MRTKKIMIRRGASKNPDPTTGSEVIRFEELRNEVLQGKILKFLLRYQQAVVWTYWIRVTNKPSRCAILLRMSSYGDCLFKDDRGSTQRIGIGELVTFLGNMLYNFVHKRGLLKSLRHEVQELSLAQAIFKHRQQTPDLSSSPIYLRTDLIFGLRSG
jgi:hypothetical protein